MRQNAVLCGNGLISIKSCTVAKIQTFIDSLYGAERQFQHYFSYIEVASAPIKVILEFFQPVLCTAFSPSHWLLSHTVIVETIDSDEGE